MFSECIKKKIHPATWAVIGIKRDLLGGRFMQRGTAFAVDDKGHLLTCWHVTFMDNEGNEDCDEYVVTQPDLGGAQHKAVLVGRERGRDIALLKIEGQVKTRPVQITTAEVARGSSSAAFGHALPVADPSTGSIRVFTRAAAGIVSMPFVASRYDACPPINLYELDYFTHPGSSGGAVFLRNGSVFAFVSGCLLLDGGSGTKSTSNLSLAVNITEAIQFLKTLNIQL